MVDLPWQSTNKRSLETVMFRNITGLLVKWRFAAQNRPCIFIPVVISYHDLRQKELVTALKDQPCTVDQAFCLASDANTDTER
jgi:hypothetical protein